MWNLEVKQGYDDMTFSLKKLEHATAIIAALNDSIVPDRDGNKLVFTLTYEKETPKRELTFREMLGEEEKENTDESL